MQQNDTTKNPILRQPNHTKVINAGVGVISFNTNSLQLDCMMASLQKAIEKHGSLKIERFLDDM